MSCANIEVEIVELARVSSNPGHDSRDILSVRSFRQDLVTCEIQANKPNPLAYLVHGVP